MLRLEYCRHGTDNAYPEPEANQSPHKGDRILPCRLKSLCFNIFFSLRLFFH